MDASAYLEIIKNFGGFGLAAWIVYHTMRHTIPRICDQFTQNLSEQRKAYHDCIEKQRVDFVREISEQRLHFADLLTQLIREQSKPR